MSATKLLGRALLAAGLVTLPSCFLPDWRERPWVDDDTTGPGDDDVTGDDDTAPAELDLEGDAQLHISYYGYGANCTVPILAELDAERTKLDGDGDCALYESQTASLEIDCDVTGAAVSGTALVYDESGTIGIPLSIPVSGTWDADARTIQLDGSANFYGVEGQVSIFLEAL